MKNSVKSMSATVLLVSLLGLAACQKKEASQVTSKTSSTSQVSSSSTAGSSSSNSVNSASSSQVASSSSQSEQQQASSESQASAEQAAPAQTTGMDINAIAAGDFSSVAGTWTNAQGDSVTFTAQGLQSSDMDIYANGVSNGLANFTYAPRNANVGSAALTMVPAGTPAQGGTVYSQDAIVIGQSLSAEETPYYRSN